MCVNWIGLVEIQYLLKKEPSQDKKIQSTCKTYYANKGMRKKILVKNEKPHTTS
jgi:hypothetical protein